MTDTPQDELVGPPAPEAQEETTTEEERVAATAALVAAENAGAPSQDDVDELNRATPLSELEG